jgi:arsenate reductase
MLKVYTLAQCKIDFEERAIRETPPTLAELKTMLAAQGGQIGRLFNSSGIEYRALKMAERLPAMSGSEKLRLLAGNGSLVKRPFAVGEGVGLVGWNEAKWAAALGGRSAQAGEKGM